MNTSHLDVRSMLGSAGAFKVGSNERRGAVLVAVAVASEALYGAVCGSWCGSPEQVVYSAIKVPMLLGITGLLSLPSFYALNAVLGLRDDFAAACRGVLSAQATLGLTLASLAPVTGFAYISNDSYPGATLSNGSAFLLATLAGQWTLARHYRPLIQRNGRHRVALGAWIVLYVFVAIQMAWSLRPFIGDPAFETQFLRKGAWTNAYVDAVRAMRIAL